MTDFWKIARQRCYDYRTHSALSRARWLDRRNPQPRVLRSCLRANRKCFAADSLNSFEQDSQLFENSVYTCDSGDTLAIAAKRWARLSSRWRYAMAKRHVKCGSNFGRNAQRLKMPAGKMGTVWVTCIVAREIGGLAGVDQSSRPAIDGRDRVDQLVSGARRNRNVFLRTQGYLPYRSLAIIRHRP